MHVVRHADLGASGMAEGQPGSTKVNSFCEMSCQRLTRFKVIYLQREDEKERGAVGVLLTNPK